VRRFTLRGLLGAVCGTIVGVIAVALLSDQDVPDVFLSGIGFRGLQWAAILLIPVFAAGAFKRILMYAPVIGQFGLRIGCIPVDRGKRGAAITKMLADVKAGVAHPGQLIIYPQGTRVAPGAEKPYKKGTGALYRELGQPCIPVATNIGVFWPKRGVYRKPGTAVVEFLDEIAPGMEPHAFMALIEERIEHGLDRRTD